MGWSDMAEPGAVSAWALPDASAGMLPAVLAAVCLSSMWQACTLESPLLHDSFPTAPMRCLPSTAPSLHLDSHSQVALDIHLGTSQSCEPPGLLAQLLAGQHAHCCRQMVSAGCCGAFKCRGQTWQLVVGQGAAEVMLAFQDLSSASPAGCPCGPRPSWSGPLTMRASH